MTDGRWVTDYKVVKERSLKDLNEEVVKALRQGWQPLGPAIPMEGPGDWLGHMQTLVKYQTEYRR